MADADIDRASLAGRRQGAATVAENCGNQQCEIIRLLPLLSPQTMAKSRHVAHGKGESECNCTVSEMP